MVENCILSVRGEVVRWCVRWCFVDDDDDGGDDDGNWRKREKRGKRRAGGAGDFIFFLLGNRAHMTSLLSDQLSAF